MRYVKIEVPSESYQYKESLIDSLLFLHKFDTHYYSRLILLVLKSTLHLVLDLLLHTFELMEIYFLIANL